MTLKFDGWPRKTIGHIFYTTPSFVHHLKTMSEFKLELQSGNAQFGSKSAFFCPMWPWNFMDDLENNRAPLLCYVKLCAPFQSHRWIQTGVTVRKRSIRVKIGDFFVPFHLEIWRMTLKNNGAPLPCLLRCFKLCASFHSHHWIQTGVTVRKHPIRIEIDDFCPVWPWNLTQDLEKQ